MELTTGELKLKKLMHILVFVFFAALFIYGAGPLIGPFKAFFRQLPFVSNSVVKVGLMMLLCQYAAGDIRNRRGLVGIFIVAHVISVAAMLVLIFVGAANGLVTLGQASMPVTNVLWGAIALDGVITVVVLIFYLGAKSGPGSNSRDDGALTDSERLLRVFFIAFGILFVGGGVLYETGPLIAGLKSFFVELPFVTNSVVKVGTLALLCFYIGKDVRNNLSAVSILIGGHLISMAALLVFILFSDVSVVVDLAGNSVTMESILWGAFVLDGGIAGLFYVLSHTAWSQRYDLKFFRPTAFRALLGVCDVVILGKDEKISTHEIARNVDMALSEVRAARTWVHRLALMALQFHPVLYFKAPLSELDSAERLSHLKKHFEREVLLPAIPDWWRRLVQIIIRIGKQLSYVGYYNDKRIDSTINYTRFEDRPRYKQLNIPAPKEHPLKVDTPDDIDGEVIETEVCVIGSGAAGATLAYNLAAAGKDVLILERGRYVQPRDFTDNEVDMMAKLYADGVFQQTSDFRFTVLQGSCVGGSTVVNNAVSFAPPEHVLKAWNSVNAHGAGLDLNQLRKSVDYISSFLPIAKQPAGILNPSGVKYMEGIKKLNLSKAQLDADIVSANIVDCYGCGYCNIGCAYGKKLSMLDKMLPEAQRLGKGSVRIIAECEVERIRSVSGKPNRIIDIRAKLAGKSKLTLKADKFIVAAGAISSSYLLLKSGIGRDLPVGEQVCFNMGSPVTAEFPDSMHAYDGLQISHYGFPQTERGFVVETWWNPPVSQAVNMPGWFDVHYNNMKKYDRLMAVGVLVGTENNGRVGQALTGGADIDYVPTPGDLAKLADGLKQVGEILFAAGASRLMLNTWKYQEFTEPKQLSQFYTILSDPKYITLGTGHPQGGNAMSVDPKHGVVDGGFRVHGYDNLYVCDASVFPSSITVNPQLTVMALAHYAAQLIKDD